MDPNTIYIYTREVHVTVVLNMWGLGTSEDLMKTRNPYSEKHTCAHIHMGYFLPSQHLISTVLLLEDFSTLLICKSWVDTINSFPIAKNIAQTCGVRKVNHSGKNEQDIGKQALHRSIRLGWRQQHWDFRDSNGREVLAQCASQQLGELRWLCPRVEAEGSAAVSSVILEELLAV